MPSKMECPQDSPKTPQDAVFGRFLENFGRFSDVFWKLVDTNNGSKIDINFEDEKPTKR